MTNKTFTLLGTLAFFFFAFSFAEASSVTLSIPASIPTKETTTFQILLNVDGEAVNAVEGDISIPTGAEITEVNDANTIVSVWLEKPVLNGMQIHFSGIIPGGFTGTGGVILSVKITPQAEGPLSIARRNIHIYSQNGKLEPKSSDFTTLLSVSDDAPVIAENKDTESPEAFTPIISREEGVLSGKYFISFAAQDKGSGIDHYEIKEQSTVTYLGGRWVRAESPYVLYDQFLTSTIYVRAFDKAGNTYTAVLYPTNYHSWLTAAFYTFVLMVAVLLIYGIRRLFVLLLS